MNHFKKRYYFIFKIKSLSNNYIKNNFVNLVKCYVSFLDPEYVITFSILNYIYI